jgi:hypothetical protein
MLPAVIVAAARREVPLPGGPALSLRGSRPARRGSRLNPRDRTPNILAARVTAALAPVLNRHIIPRRPATGPATGPILLSVPISGTAPNLRSRVVTMRKPGLVLGVGLQITICWDPAPPRTPASDPDLMPTRTPTPDYGDA